MAISCNDLPNGLRFITLTERLDILGTEQIAPQFEEMVSSAESHVVVDLTGVTFLASIGIRALISNAKALQKRGKRMAVAVGDNAAASKTLHAAGIDVLIPVQPDLAAAEKALHD